MTTRLSRADQTLWHLMEAVSASDFEVAIDLADTLKREFPELTAWCRYVAAGCAASRGAPAHALAQLYDGYNAGEWWSSRLLSDPCLTPVWEIDDRLPPLAAARCEAFHRLHGPEWEIVRNEAGARCVIAVLHGNGPAPQQFIASFWGRLPDCSVLTIRSSQYLAPAVPYWPDAKRAIRELRHVLQAAYAAEELPSALIVAGLGAGGMVAIEAALFSNIAWSAIAFGPDMGSLIDRLPESASLLTERSLRRCVLFAGGSKSAIASCYRFDEWAASSGIQRLLVCEPGMGHAFPDDFLNAVDQAVSWLLNE